MQIKYTERDTRSCWCIAQKIIACVAATAACAAASKARATQAVTQKPARAKDARDLHATCHYDHRGACAHSTSIMAPIDSKTAN
eukprot:16689-Heterococcus_DN1.PRE.5